MAGNPRVLELLEEMLDSGLTPEEVCRDCPELLSEVQQRWKHFCLIDAEVEALLPDPAIPPNADVIVPPTAGLPQVPGYEVEAVLGRGGMGVVYRARHLRLSRTVALKMLIAGPYAGPHERARFQREAEAVAGLRHANIVQVYDVADYEGLPYFTMECVEGGSLAQKLAGMPQPARQAATLMATLAEAVHVAHQGGIVHRDLKPANVLLTADGTSKITDFGLARRLTGEAASTQSGVPLGTPSYMAPEQAAGRVRDIGPAADVYALGAILYELLTGRPPFRGETAAETVLQVIHQEPASPSYLNANVPRDLETVCLKCLSKEPERRYASAAALADDLKRFLEGRPIQARPLGWGARLWRWSRRNPAAAAQVVAALTLVGLSVGSALWLERQRAEQRAETERQQAVRREETARQEGRESKAVEAVLEQAASLQKQGRWPEARAVLNGAPGLLAPSAAAGLRERVRRAIADTDMVSKLEDIRLRLLEGKRSHDAAAPSGDHLYAEAFRHYGIAAMTLEPMEARARIRDSAIRETLLAFLHDWLLFWASDAHRDKLRIVVDRADDDEWRRRLRKALSGTYDDEKWRDLLRAREAPAQPPVVLAGLAGTLIHRHQEEETRALLREAQRRHPEEFWLNFQLGYYLQDEHPQEAIGYFRVALASRPQSGQAQMVLGRVLRDTGDEEGAIAAFSKAIELNPNGAGARDLARVLAPRGELEKARVAWEQKILQGALPDYERWYGYPQLCAYLGNEEAYRRACKTLLERSRDNTDNWTIAERDSLACLLLPSSGDELRRAVALVDRAVAAGPKFPDPDNAYLQFVKGLAAYRQGRSAEAVPLLQESAVLLPNRPGPRLVLAMAQFQSGSAKEARKTLAAAVRAYNWKQPQADHPTAWVSHVLRREAETLILPNLPAFLHGRYQPQDNDERLALLGTCEFRGLYSAAARLCADAFAADPGLAAQLTTECRYSTLRGEHFDDDRMDLLNTECRYLAARCAALAGCGLGKDGAKLSDAERTRWRKQARVWLQADLALWVRTLESGFRDDSDLAKKMLTYWRVEPDLAGLRELNALDALSADEQKDCFALWDAVGLVLQHISQYERAIALHPKIADAQRAFRANLIQQGRMEEARVAWQTSLEANPLDHNAWFGYAELCLFLGREDEYLRARQALLERFRVTVNPYFAERTGRACLLRPATGDELRQAVTLTRRAAAADPSIHTWAYPWFLFAQGLAEYRQGRFDQAVSMMRGDASRVPGPAPRLVLAMALHRSGQVAEARKTLAAAGLYYDWGANQADRNYEWICHVIRREADGTILPNLPAFLEGKYQPQDSDERLALLATRLAICEFQGLHGASARLYSEAFALAQSVPQGTRYYAARAAALAGCGQGKDGDKLDDKERALWRWQAFQWLRQDLSWWGTALDNGNVQTNAQVQQWLQKWQTDGDLAGVRSRDALARLPDEERKQWESLWCDVGSLLRRVNEPE
jgi:serine/threonine-protein kinase